MTERCIAKSWTHAKQSTLDAVHKVRGTSLVVQLRLCASSAGGTGSIPGQGTKIPYAVWRSQKKFFFKVRNRERITNSAQAPLQSGSLLLGQLAKALAQRGWLGRCILIWARTLVSLPQFCVSCPCLAHGPERGPLPDLMTAIMQILECLWAPSLRLSSVHCKMPHSRS